MPSRVVVTIIKGRIFATPNDAQANLRISLRLSTNLMK